MDSIFKINEKRTKRNRCKIKNYFYLVNTVYRAYIPLTAIT